VGDGGVQVTEVSRRGLFGWLVGFAVAAPSLPAAVEKMAASKTILSMEDMLNDVGLLPPGSIVNAGSDVMWLSPSQFGILTGGIDRIPSPWWKNRDSDDD